MRAPFGAHGGWVRSVVLRRALCAASIGTGYVIAAPVLGGE